MHYSFFVIILLAAFNSDRWPASASPPLPPAELVHLVWASGNEGRPCVARASLLPGLLGLQLQRVCVQQRLLELQEILCVEAAGTQPVPAPFPPAVLVHLVWVRGNIVRPRTALAPLRPLLLGLQLEGARVQQCLLERQELLVLCRNCVSTQPVPVPFPPVMLVDLVWVGRDIGRPRTILASLLPLFLGHAPLFPLFRILQLEGACVQQRLLERQEV